MIDQIQRGPHTNLERVGEPLPDALADYLFCESLGFAMLPWEVAEMDLDRYTFWSDVIGAYNAEYSRSKAILQARANRRR